MNPTSLGPSVIGGEILGTLAQERATGTLTFTGQSSCIFSFLEGRPVSVDQDGRRHVDPNAIRASLRSAARKTEGTARFNVQHVEKTSAVVDTLGEVLFGLVQGMTVESAQSLIKLRRTQRPQASANYAQLSQVVQQYLKIEIPKPQGDLQAWISGDPKLALAALTLSSIGGVTGLHRYTIDEDPKDQETTLGRANTGEKERAPRRSLRSSALPGDPQARMRVVEIERFYLQLDGQTHYQLLGIDESATSETIKKAYMDAARTWHRDVLVAMKISDDVLSMAQAVFTEMTEAHRILSDEDERKGYDFVLSRERKGLPTDPGVILEADQEFQRAKSMVKRGKANGAEPILAKVCEMNPGEAEFFIYWGYSIYAAQGSAGADVAKSTIAKGLSLNPKLSDGHFFLGRIAVAEGDARAGVREYKKCIEMNPKHKEAEFELRLAQRRQDSDGGQDSGAGGFAGILSKLFKRR